MGDVKKTLCQIVYYVPESHLSITKQALFDTGAGKVGCYDSCAWQTRGKGQFRPLLGSDPTIGEQGHLETLDEYKVELVCEASILSVALDALKAAHPYEEPAYFVLASAPYH